MPTFLSSPVSLNVTVEPISFYCNEATCTDNYFQNNIAAAGDPILEHRNFTAALGKCTSSTDETGCKAPLASYRLSDETQIAPRPHHIFSTHDIDCSHLRDVVGDSKKRLEAMPDAIFPNNSFSVHETLIGDCDVPILRRFLVARSTQGEEGTAVVFVLYPMCPGRRDEVPCSLLSRALELSTYPLPSCCGVEEAAATKPRHPLDPDRSPSSVGILPLDGTATTSKTPAVFRPLYADTEKETLSCDSWCLDSWDLCQVLPVSSTFGAPEKVDVPVVVIDLRPFENISSLLGRAVEGGSGPEQRESWVLEGTGAVNFLHRFQPQTGHESVRPEVFAYCVASQRAHPVVFHFLCRILGIPSTHRFLFPSAVDAAGKYIYHTNVVGWVGGAHLVPVAAGASDGDGEVPQSKDTSQSSSTATSASFVGLCGWAFKALRFANQSASDTDMFYREACASEGRFKLFTNEADFVNNLQAVYQLPAARAIRIEGRSTTEPFFGPPLNVTSGLPDGCVEISLEQMHHFAGNSLFVQCQLQGGGLHSSTVLMSTAAEASLLFANAHTIEEDEGNGAPTSKPTAGDQMLSVLCFPELKRSARGSSNANVGPINAFPIPLIEQLGGGSVRCLIASSMAFSREGFARMRALIGAT